MDKRRGITLESFSTPHLFLILLSSLGVGFSLYLTNHYFEVNFPSGLNEGSLCDINSYFNCDASTKSVLSNIAGIPLSVFGLLFSLNILVSCIFPSENYERTNHLLSKINAIGCIGLFLFTVISLGSLCPFCALYWITSILIALLYHKKGLEIEMPNLQTIGIMGVLALVTVGGYGMSISNKEKKQTRMTSALINQFKSIPTGEEPETPHKIYMSTENFKDAPIRITKFSDFQCPACKSVADILPDLIERYKGKINIQYMFYPLDQNCNASMKRQLHPLACEAAYIAHCSGEKFHDVHDEIFLNQRNLTSKWLEDKAKELGVEECAKSQAAKDIVKAHIAKGDELKVSSTPTLIINGKKIAGGLPLNQFIMLFDALLKQ